MGLLRSVPPQPITIISQPAMQNQLAFLMPFADDSFGPPQAQEHAQISLAQQDGKVFCGHKTERIAVPWQSVEKSRNGALDRNSDPVLEHHQIALSRAYPGSYTGSSLCSVSS